MHAKIAIHFWSLIVAAIVSLTASQSFAAGEVRLIRAYSSVSSAEGLTDQTTKYDIVVANLAFDKKVSIHVRTPSGQWIDQPGHYVESTPGNAELWRVEYHYRNNATPAESFRDLEFVAKYEVLGATYWDNNSSQNFHLGSQGGALLKDTNVLVSYGFAAGAANGFYGAIDIRNVAYQKTVKVVYSTDDWQHSQTADAQYVPQYFVGDGDVVVSPNASGVERWVFQLPAVSASQVKFRVTYVVNGTTYVDANFGYDYTARAGGSDGPAS